jgi:hypothetical protein
MIDQNTLNWIIDRVVFTLTWLTITTISTALATVFIIGLKTILKL